VYWVLTYGKCHMYNTHMKQMRKQNDEVTP